MLDEAQIAQNLAALRYHSRASSTSIAAPQRRAAARQQRLARAAALRRVLRDIGRHFTVNRNDRGKTYRERLECELPCRSSSSTTSCCRLRLLGTSTARTTAAASRGADQWGNMNLGVELIVGSAPINSASGHAGHAGHAGHRDR